MWQLVRLSVKLLPQSTKRSTHDRYILEQVIFKDIYINTDYGRILFVGCDSYTSWYPRIFDFRKGIVFETVDPSPGKKTFGARRHHQVTHFEALASWQENKGQYDLIILNGVFNYGLDSLSEKMVALEAVYTLLQAGGRLLIGYRDLEVGPDFELEMIDRTQFVDTPIPGLSCSHYLTKHTNRHSFLCFLKS
jgi:hypothetical protein